MNLVKRAYAANNNKPADGTTDMAVSYAGSWLNPGTFHGQGARPDLKNMRESNMIKLCLDISNGCKRVIKICSEKTSMIQDKEFRIDKMLSELSSDFKLAIIQCLQGQCGDKYRDNA